jgi:hypothetical protein
MVGGCDILAFWHSQPKHKLCYQRRDCQSQNHDFEAEPGTLRAARSGQALATKSQCDTGDAAVTVGVAWLFYKTISGQSRWDMGIAVPSLARSML